MAERQQDFIMDAFHLIQVDTSIVVFVTYWMPRKIERCLCRLVSLNEKHPIFNDTTRNITKPAVMLW